MELLVEFEYFFIILKEIISILILLYLEVFLCMGFGYYSNFCEFVDL